MDKYLDLVRELKKTMEHESDNHINRDWYFSRATIPGQSEPGSNGNEGASRIPQSPSITGISGSDCLVSYPGHSLGWVLPLCRFSVGKFNSSSRLGKSLSRATIPGQSEPGSNGNEGVLRIPQSPSITGTSGSDCLVSYPKHSLGWVLPLCRGAVSIFYSPSRLGKALSRATIPGQSEPGSNGISWKLVGEGFTPLQRCSRWIRQSQLTRQEGGRWIVWIEDSMNASIWGRKDNIKKNKERRITTTRNRTGNKNHQNNNISETDTTELIFQATN